MQGKRETGWVSETHAHMHPSTFKLSVFGCKLAVKEKKTEREKNIHTKKNVSFWMIARQSDLSVPCYIIFSLWRAFFRQRKLYTFFCLFYFSFVGGITARSSIYYRLSSNNLGNSKQFEFVFSLRFLLLFFFPSLHWMGILRDIERCLDKNDTTTMTTTKSQQQQ